MAGKAVSYQFLDVLAKSLSMDTETVKRALEVAEQGKAPTNHASQQAIFGTADEQMYGHVKIAHEVTNASTDGVAVSPAAVYTYAPDRDTTPKGITPTITVRHEPADWVAHLTAFAAGNFVGVSGDFETAAPSARKIILSGVPAYSKLGVDSIRSDGLWTVNGQGSTITLTSNELGAKTSTFMVIIPFIPNNA